MINGFKEIAITKLDVLDTFDEIKICIGYQCGKKLLKTFPTDVKTLETTVPLYETFGGWKTRTSSVTSFPALPLNARKYIAAIGSLTETEIHMVSVGARRDQTMIVH